MGILSTVSAEGRPWGSAIYYVTDEDFTFYFVTREGTFKYHNLDQQSHAALTVADPDTQVTVQAAGIVSKVPVEEYMDVVFHKLDTLIGRRRSRSSKPATTCPCVLPRPSSNTPITDS